MCHMEAKSGQLIEFLRDIKFSHSLFAFPFVICTFFIEDMPAPTMMQTILLLLCMFAARSFAMGANRLLDWQLDMVNPRTSARSIPSGRLGLPYALFFTICCGVVFVCSSFYLSNVAFYASMPVLVVLAGYSLMKRIHYLTHFYLGVCLGIAPSAVYIALTSEVSLPLICLGIAIACWTAGFDILYSLQDMIHDRKNGLNSVPAKFGARGAVKISRLLFLIMTALLVYIGLICSMGKLYYLGVGLVGLILVYEHYLVRHVKTGLENTNFGKVFFDMNAWVSVGFMIFVIADRIVL